MAPHRTMHQQAGTPISTLIAYISRLRPCVVSAEDANTWLGPIAAETCGQHAELASFLSEFGWSDGAFTAPVDLSALQVALHKHKYERLQELGKGSYGVVYRARNRESGEQVALKKLRYSLEDEGLPVSTIREICLLRDLQHPNIVQ